MFPIALSLFCRLGAPRRVPSTSLPIATTVAELRGHVSAWKRAGERVALVPTMGALHAGHAALITAGRARADRVVASVFVNPAQFNDPKDLERYPRTPEADAATLAEAGCGLLFAPSTAEVYPQGFGTAVSVAGIPDRWEGEHRPGHFDGVATVVAKLLAMALPDVALFGEKDWQQLAVIRRLTLDLNLPVEIVGVPTVREADGLAMSSRNMLLDAASRAAAAALPRALERAGAAIAAGERPAAALAQAESALRHDGFTTIDYVAFVGADDLEPMTALGWPARLLAAAWIGGVRLIDNMPLPAGEPSTGAAHLGG